MIDTTHQLPVVRQAQLLELSRSSIYYLARPTSAADLELMRRIDELHLEFPFAGSRMLRDLLKGEGHFVGRKHVGTLMRTMGIEALYRKPNTSRRHGTPEIFNTDQGSQFTSLEFTDILKAHNIQISMDGKGCWRDNVFVERLWKSIKYEEIYLHAYDSVSAARTGIGKYITLYNQRRPHTEHGGETPDVMYFGNLDFKMAA